MQSNSNDAAVDITSAMSDQLSKGRRKKQKKQQQKKQEVCRGAWKFSADLKSVKSSKGKAMQIKALKAGFSCFKKEYVILFCIERLEPSNMTKWETGSLCVTEMNTPKTERAPSIRAVVDDSVPENWLNLRGLKDTESETKREREKERWLVEVLRGKAEKKSVKVWRQLTYALQNQIIKFVDN